MQIESAVSLQSKGGPGKRKATAAFTALMLALALAAASVPVTAQDKPAQGKPTQDKPAPDKPALVVNTLPLPQACHGLTMRPNFRSRPLWSLSVKMANTSMLLTNPTTKQRPPTR
jgi:hypothetical protein